MQKLASPYQAKNWGASYVEVMPFIQEAMAQALQELRADFPEQFQGDLVSIVLDLCHPNPRLRGRLGKNEHAAIGALWLQRYASRFDVLEKRARVRGAKPNV